MDRVPIIHVAGTKGKGSTCAFLESILRHHGLKTALYTSPHLVTIRERIRINGKPITEDYFTKKFYHIYNTLERQQEKESDMPGYFKFMTILMFDIILSADIDVAIVEVGIGGELDCTNIIKRPKCVGITSLELDHMPLLGNDLASIAWQKAGIFKYHVPAYTVNQHPDALNILHQRSVEKNCNLTLVSIDKLKILDNYPPKLGIESNVQLENAALAVQLAETFIEKLTIDDEKLTNLDNKKLTNLNDQKNRVNFNTKFVEEGLINARWPGRSQIIKDKYFDIYLDGAHTCNSMINCVDWFKNSTAQNFSRKVLIFNSTGSRDFQELFSVLKVLNFDLVYFVPNFSGVTCPDQENIGFGIEEQKKRCFKQMKAWNFGPATCKDSVAQAVDNILNYQSTDCNDNNEKTIVLVTGSLHLVGATLAFIDQQTPSNKNEKFS